MASFPLVVESFKSDYGFTLGARAPIEKEVSQVITITNNTQKKLSWKFYTANTEKYTFRIYPGTGSLGKVFILFYFNYFFYLIIFFIERVL